MDMVLSHAQTFRLVLVQFLGWGYDSDQPCQETKTNGFVDHIIRPDEKVRKYIA